MDPLRGLQPPPPKRYLYKEKSVLGLDGFSRTWSIEDMEAQIMFTGIITLPAAYLLYVLVSEGLKSPNDHAKRKRRK